MRMSFCIQRSATSSGIIVSFCCFRFKVHLLPFVLNNISVYISIQLLYYHLYANMYIIIFALKHAFIFTHSHLYTIHMHLLKMCPSVSSARRRPAEDSKRQFIIATIINFIIIIAIITIIFVCCPCPSVSSAPRRPARAAGRRPRRTPPRP